MMGELNLVQLKVVDGRVDVEDLNRKIENIPSDEITLTPVLSASGDKESVISFYKGLISQLEREVDIRTCAIVDGEMREIRYSAGEEFDMYYCSNEKWQVWEFGNDLRYRWVVSPNIKEVFSFLVTWKDPEDQYFYYASNEIYRGIVIPGGSFVYYNDDEYTCGEYDSLEGDVSSPTELVEKIFDFYIKEKGIDRALIAATDGDKSEVILKIASEKFSDAKVISFWNDKGCKKAEKYGFSCSVVDLPERDARLLESWMYVHAKMEGRIPLWGAEKDFLMKHKIRIPNIFTPFWFFEREDLDKIFSFSNKFAYDDVDKVPLSSF